MNSDVAVIGAGLAGLTCAHRLRQAGMRVTVLEKSRGIGGRMATRRADDMRFDHGAQYVTARGDGFRAFWEEAAAAGHAAVWEAAGASPDGAARWVGVPAMNAPLKPWAAALEVRHGTRVAAITRAGGGWRLAPQDGAAVEAAQVVCTVPAPQAAALLPEDATAARAALAEVAVAPCWTLMVAFAGAPSLPETQRDPASDLAWVARDASKPGRSSGAHHWVAHAAPGWSERHLELTPADAAARMLAMLTARAGGLPPVTHAAAHRWRYAMTTRPLGRAVLDAGGGLLLGGDWTLGAKCEAAFDSGAALADAVLAAR